MKNLIISILLVFFSLASFSQQQTVKQLSKGEEFSQQSGALIEKQFNTVGTVKGIEIAVAKVNDLISGKKISFVRFEYVAHESYGSDTKVGSLDVDELDALIKSLKILLSDIFTTTREVYTEVNFKSRSGLSAGAYFNVEKKKWVTYIQLDQYDSNSDVFMTTEDFTQLQSLLEKAKTFE